MNEGETFVHCVGHNGPVSHGETVYSIHDGKNGEQLGVICERCLFGLLISQYGPITLYKGITIPAESDSRYVKSVEPHGLAVGYTNTDVLMAAFGNSAS